MKNQFLRTFSCPTVRQTMFALAAISFLTQIESAHAECGTYENAGKAYCVGTVGDYDIAKCASEYKTAACKMTSEWVCSMVCEGPGAPVGTPCTSNIQCASGYCVGICTTH
jgi:hypothetical protein